MSDIEETTFKRIQTVLKEKDVQQLITKFAFYIVRNVYNYYEKERTRMVAMKGYNIQKTEKTKRKIRKFEKLPQGNINDILVTTTTNSVQILIPRYYKINDTIIDKAYKDAYVSWMINCRVYGGQIR